MCAGIKYGVYGTYRRGNLQRAIHALSLPISLKIGPCQNACLLCLNAANYVEEIAGAQMASTGKHWLGVGQPFEGTRLIEWHAVRTRIPLEADILGLPGYREKALRM